MQRIALTIVLLAFLIPVLPAQTADYDQDVSSIDHILTALYASISGEKDEPRDWNRFLYLFADGALLTPTQDQDSTITFRRWTPQEYAQRAAAWFQNTGFFEEEIYRVTEEYANIAHVFSTYTSRRTQEGEVFARGINSIQLFHDGQRWWIMSIYWAAESEKHPLPDEYLPE